MKPIYRYLLAGLITAAVRLPAQTITTQPTSQIVPPGGNVSFTAAVTGPRSFQWQFNGTNLPNHIITTVAGNGLGGNAEGVAATNASLNTPGGVAVDTSGNLFIADTYDWRIRKVDTNGIITSVAGGVLGFSGDRGPATNASFAFAQAVTVDAFGNLFIADTENDRIRKVDTNGIITTVAGSGPSYYTYGSGQTGSFSGDGGPAIQATLWFPNDVFVDTKGNLFIADTENGRIRKVDTNGIITTVVAGLNSPSGVTVDGAGNILIAPTPGNSAVAVDSYDNVFYANIANNQILENSTLFAGNGLDHGYSGDGGAATNAGLNYPLGVAVDTSGNVFIADTYDNRIRKVTVQGPTLTLNNVSTNNAGNYRVIITGASGSVTSSVVTLTIAVPPVITSQPQSLVVTNGHSAGFSVTATGLPPLAYNWFFNGTNLSGATNAMLTLRNSFPVNDGAYMVSITNGYGSVTSNPAILTVFPLGITRPTMLASGQFQIGFDTATGVNYEVQYSTNLTQWLPLITLGGVGVPLIVIDPNLPGSQQRFYRIVLSPQ